MIGALSSSHWKFFCGARLLCALAVIFLLAGCITSGKPLSDPGTVDDAAVGTWKKIGDQGETPGDLIIKQEKDGWYSLEERDYPPNAAVRTTLHQAFPTRGKRYNFANLKYAEAKVGVESPQTAADFDQRYLLMRYDISGKRLTVRAIKYERLKQEVDAKRINGSAWQTTWGVNARIDDDPKKLLELFDGPHGDEFFGEPLVYEKRE